MKKATTIAVRFLVSLFIFMVAHGINFTIMKAQGREATSGIGWLIYPAALVGIVAVWRRKPKQALPTLNKSAFPTLNKE